MLTHYVLWRDALEIVPCPRLNLRVAPAVLGRCNCSAEHRDLTGCLICILSIAAHVTSGMLRKAMEGPIDREQRARIIGEWLQTEARFLA
jgi:hypothetical protein